MQKVGAKRLLRGLAIAQDGFDYGSAIFQQFSHEVLANLVDTLTQVFYFFFSWKLQLSILSSLNRKTVSTK